MLTLGVFILHTWNYKINNHFKQSHNPSKSLLGINQNNAVSEKYVFVLCMLCSRVLFFIFHFFFPVKWQRSSPNLFERGVLEITLFLGPPFYLLLYLSPALCGIGYLFPTAELTRESSLCHMDSKLAWLWVHALTTQLSTLFSWS